MERGQICCWLFHEPSLGTQNYSLRGYPEMNLPRARHSNPPFFQILATDPVVCDGCSLRGLCNETSFCTPSTVVPRGISPLCREECCEEIFTARGRPSNARLCVENCALETQQALSWTGRHRSVRLAEGAARCRGPAASAPATFAATRRRASAQMPGAR